MSKTSERERIKQAIAALEAQRSILGEDVVHTALASLRADLAALQSEERRGLVTVLFADVSGYTAFSSDLDAEDVQDIMHRLWSRLDQIILSHGGHIDKHIGDRVMAVWSVTTPQENDPEQAEWYSIAETHRLLGEAYLSQGRVDDALEPARQALTLAQAVEQPLFIGRAWLTLGRLTSRLATPIIIGSVTHQAADCFAHSEQQFREAGARAQRRRALLVCSKYESERADREQGEALWQIGTRVLAQLGISQPTIEEIRL